MSGLMFGKKSQRNQKSNRLPILFQVFSISFQFYDERPDYRESFLKLNVMKK